MFNVWAGGFRSHTRYSVLAHQSRGVLQGHSVSLLLCSEYLAMRGAAGFWLQTVE